MGRFQRSNREVVELQMQWWARKNARPLVGTFAPAPCPYGGMDFGISPGDLVERKLANMIAYDVVPGDNIRTARVEFGTAFLPALAGADFEYDGHTSWSIPSAECAAELKIAQFDRNHPLWRDFARAFEAILKHWSWDTYLPSTSVLVGPMDLLSAMLGPENLAMELYADPDSVKLRAMEAAELFLSVYRAQRDMIRDAGLKDGMADWMMTWLPGEGVCYSEDFAALCGEQHFREFFQKPNRYVMSQVGTAYLHLHSAAAPCLPALLEIKECDAIELSNDPNGPALENACVPLQVSNWEHPLKREEIEYMLSNLRPEGMKITLQAKTVTEAEELYEMARNFGQ
jgi:hypothetical protein